MSDLARLHHRRLIYKNQLCFYILTTNKCQLKLKSHLNINDNMKYLGTHLLRDK